MKNYLKYILIGGFLLRCSVFLVTDTAHLEYYEYGELAKNILAGKGYSLFYTDNDKLNYKFSEEAVPQPSAYMPPAYVFFLLPFFLIKEAALRGAVIILMQIALSSFIIYLMYFYVRKFFSEKYALMAALITALNPEFIYAVRLITPTVVFHLLILALFITLYNYFEKRNYKTLILSSVLTALIIYLRSEMALLTVLIWLYFLYKKEYKNLAIYISFVVILILPWTIRNYIVFNQPIPLTTNFGLNLYRGNNPYEIGVWGTLETEKEIIARAHNKPLEIAMNDFYSSEAINFISENPGKFISNSVLKLYDLWIYNLHINRIDHVAAKIFYPVFFLLFAVGYTRKFSLGGHVLENFFFISSSITAMAFFTLPRYQIMLHIMMMPFIAAGIIYIWGRIKDIKKSR